MSLSSTMHFRWIAVYRLSQVRSSFSCYHRPTRLSFPPVYFSRGRSRHSKKAPCRRLCYLPIGSYYNLHSSPRSFFSHALALFYGVRDSDIQEADEAGSGGRPPFLAFPMAFTAAPIITPTLPIHFLVPTSFSFIHSRSHPYSVPNTFRGF